MASTIDKVLQQIVDLMRPLSSDQRVAVFADLEGNFCLWCGEERALKDHNCAFGLETAEEI